jgi:hypothetical protein
MSINNYADNLDTAVRYALETTRAIAVCPFHSDVTIRVGDDAAESHGYARIRNIIKKRRHEVEAGSFDRRDQASTGRCRRR